MSGVRLFVYGTLRDDELVRRLTGRRFPSKPATLDGYRRAVDPATGYPVAHEAAGQSVDGRLLEEVDDAALRALDAYEGDRYRRVIVRVRTDGGGNVDAYAYVPAPS